MFAHASDASKVAFVWLVKQLQRWGYSMIDCQIHTEHLARFGARLVPREDFLDSLHAGLEDSESSRDIGQPSLWSFDRGFWPHV